MGTVKVQVQVAQENNAPIKVIQGFKKKGGVYLAIAAQNRDGGMLFLDAYNKAHVDFINKLIDKLNIEFIDFTVKKEEKKVGTPVETTL